MRREADALLIRKILTQSLLHILRTKFKLSSNSRRGFFSLPKSLLPTAQQFAFGHARRAPRSAIAQQAIVIEARNEPLRMRFRAWLYAWIVIATSSQIHDIPRR